MKLTLNLASRTYLNRRALVTFYWVLIVALVALLVFNLLFFYRSQVQAQQIRGHLEELDRDLVKGQGEAQTFNQAAYEDLLIEVEAANGIITKDSFRWSELLGQLEELVPEGVALRSIQPDFKSGSLALQGISEDIPQLRTFLDQLVADERLGEATLLQQSRIKVKDPSGQESNAVAFSVDVKGAF